MSELVDFRVLAAAKRHFFSFFRPDRVPARRKDKAFMETGERLRVTHADEQLEVRAWGSGPTILLAHGLFASGGAFRSLVPELTRAGFRAVAFDAPGHGESPGLFVYGEEMADAVLSVQSAVGPLAGVVGHSLGATYSLCAQRGGLGAPRLVCISTAAAGGSVVDFYIERYGVEPAVATHLKRLIEGFSPSHLRSPVRIASELDVPGLVIHDEADPLAKFDNGVQIARAWRGSRSLWTQGLGHVDVLHDAKVIGAVVEFLA